MNKKLVNIALLVLLLSGCNSALSKREPNGEPSSKNAPLFIRPNTNASTVNKPNTNEVSANKPATVQFNSEKYLMVKESDLNKLVIKRTNDVLLNIKKDAETNTNDNPVNKELPKVIDNYINHSVKPDEPSLTVETVKLEPNKNTVNSVNPILSFLMTFIIILAFVLGVGYFFFFKKKNVNSSEATEPVVPNAPTPTPAQAAPQIPVVSPVLPQTIVTPAAAENPITSVAQGASQAATLGVATAVVSTVVNTENTQ